MEIKDLQDKLNSTINVFKEDLNGLQVGQVSEKMLKNVIIAYEDGRKHGLLEVATVRVSGLNNLTIKPFTKHDMGAIERSLVNSGLGVNTSKQGDEILVTFPPITIERREQLAKSVIDYANKSKQSGRDIRRHYLKENKANTKEEELKIEKEIKPYIEKFNEEIDIITKNKQENLKKF